MSHSMRYAKDMISLGAVFFEVWVEEQDDPFELAVDISSLGCSTAVEPSRRVIKVWPNRPRIGLGFI